VFAPAPLNAAITDVDGVCVALVTVIEAPKEAIQNSSSIAATVTGRQGRNAEKLPMEWVTGLPDRLSIAI
jgi:hypothetical protein